MPPSSLPEFTVPYWKVAAAVVRMHKIAPEGVGAIHSRFGAFQRGGLLGAENRPGKGGKLAYGHDVFHRVLLAFELTQAGFAPAVILRLVRDFWDAKLRAIFAEAEAAIVHDRSDVVLILGGIALITDSVPNINHVAMRKLTSRLDVALSGDNTLPARALIINVSAQLRRFHTALADVHLRPDNSHLQRRASPARKRRP